MPGSKKLHELVSGFKVAMLTTVDASGEMHSRPMVAQRNGVDEDLWFFTRVDAAKVEELKRSERVSVTYADPGTETFIAVSGTAHIVKDVRKAESLWDARYEPWFPKGVTDPNLGLIRVKVEHAEYWHMQSGRMVQLVSLLRSLARGEAREHLENEKLDLTGS